MIYNRCTKITLVQITIDLITKLSSYLDDFSLIFFARTNNGIKVMPFDSHTTVLPDCVGVNMVVRQW